MKTTKQQKILNHLLSGKSITPKDAIDLYKVYRLAAVVCVLKKQGYNIITHAEHYGETRWAKYSLMYEHKYGNTTYGHRPKMDVPKPIRELFEFKHNPAETMP